MYLEAVQLLSAGHCHTACGASSACCCLAHSCCALLAPCRSAPGVTGQGLLPTTGSVDVTPPANGGPWDHYLLRVCAIATGSCSNVTCSPVAPSPSHTFCQLSSLTANTQYNVTATAVQASGTSSKTAQPATFSTPTDK